MRLQSFLCLSALLVVAGLAASACGSTSSTCEERLVSCGPRAGAGADGNAGDAGRAGGGNTGTGGMNSNAAGGPGSSGAGGAVGAGHGGSSGDAGAPAVGGSAGEAPCNDDCSGNTPICDAASNTCVECLSKADCATPRSACQVATNKCVECIDGTTCSAGKPACDLPANTCVECTGSTDCKDSTKPFCDQAAEKCVACLRQADCSSATASACNSGQCQACAKDADCSNIVGKGVCDAGTCVQCTGKKFAACGQDAGTPLVCDSLKRTCSTSKQQSAGLCQACITDAQCNAGEMCVLDKFGSPAVDVGYFCHWKQGDTANLAPADCTANGQPYVGVQKNALSVDGTVSDICTLAVSTCVARNQFRSKDCAVASVPSDATCGVSPAKDSKCVQFGATTYRCTMTCLSIDDCPGTACNTGVAPAVCALQ